MSNQTVSTDVEEVECPECGKINSLLDLQIDGCLKPDTDFECDHCGVELLIDDVDWEPTIYVSKRGRGSAA